MIQEMEEAQSSVLNQDQITQEQLLKRLDPNANYGEGVTYESVVARVRGGELVLYEGHSKPIIKEALTGQLHKGGGRPVVGDHNQRKQEVASLFSSRAMEHFDEFWDHFWATVKKGDPRAQKLYLEYVIGRPGIATGAGDMSLFKMLLERALEPKAAEVKQTYVYETVPVEVGD